MSTSYQQGDADEMNTLRARIVDRSIPEPNSGCWLWTLSTHEFGYGQMYFRGAVLRAHRLSYLAFKGAIAEGLVVRHTCNQPSCVNPDHLVSGTQRDNIHDAIRSGRFVFNPQMLSEATAVAIRSAHAAGADYRKLGRMFGISMSCARKYANSAHSPRSRQK